MCREALLHANRLNHPWQQWLDEAKHGRHVDREFLRERIHYMYFLPHLYADASLQRYLEESADSLTARLPGYANLVATTLAALPQDVHFGDATATAGQFGVTGNKGLQSVVHHGDGY